MVHSESEEKCCLQTRAVKTVLRLYRLSAQNKILLFIQVLLFECVP